MALLHLGRVKAFLLNSDIMQKVLGSGPIYPRRMRLINGSWALVSVEVQNQISANLCILALGAGIDDAGRDPHQMPILMLKLLWD